MKSWLSLIVALLPFLAHGELSPQAQQDLAGRIAAKVQRAEVWKDDAGNVTGLILINHQALTKQAGEKPGINDADLARLTGFPRLTAINIEAQGVSDAGLSVLAQMPQLRQIGFHYMGKHPKAEATPACVSVINGKPDLEILEIKHNFRMKSFAIESIITPMPNVWRLVLDTPITPEQTLHLIRRCPNVRELQLHRTECSAEQLAEIGRLLPKLEVLWWKPRHGLQAGQLAVLSEFKRLKIFSPQQFRNQLPFTGGWDALLKVKSLERIEVVIKNDENGEALKKLREQRPSLKIEPELTRSRNYDGL